MAGQREKHFNPGVNRLFGHPLPQRISRGWWGPGCLDVQLLDSGGDLRHVCPIIAIVDGAACGLISLEGLFRNKPTLGSRFHVAVAHRCSSSCMFTPHTPCAAVTQKGNVNNYWTFISTCVCVTNNATGTTKRYWHRCSLLYPATLRSVPNWYYIVQADPKPVCPAKLSKLVLAYKRVEMQPLKALMEDL